MRLIYDQFEVGDSVRIAHFGTRAADFSPRRSDWTSQHASAAQTLGLKRQIRLRLDFTNQVADGSETRGIDGVIAETVGVVEGLHLTEPEVGVGITSADCCTGVLWNGSGAVAMHLGLGCVHRDDETVIEAAKRRLDGPARLWLGCAIGPCCYGFPERDDPERARVGAIRNRWGADCVPGRVERGPRRGWAAIDHLLIAARHAESLGLPVDMSRGCTACAGLDDPDAPGYGDYYSNTRDTARGFERNLVVVWLKAGDAAER